MEYFTIKSSFFLVSSNIYIEELKKIDKFMKLLENSKVWKYINYVNTNNKKCKGRIGYNPYNLFATIIYCFAKFKASLRDIEDTHIGDKRLLRLIKRFLIVGIMEEGKYIRSEKGTPQGSILSPVLANIVMYYGIMLYMERVKTQAKGYIEIINYADDIVLCFQYREEAENTYKLLKQRLEKLGLEFAPDKTRLIEFGRFAEENRKRDGKGKPETFDFLGFTHYCSKSADGTRFRVKRKTARKKLNVNLNNIITSDLKIKVT